MATLLEAVVEVRRDRIINGLHVWIEPTSNPRKVFIRVSEEPRPRPTVEHRKVPRKRLTPPGG